MKTNRNPALLLVMLAGLLTGVWVAHLTTPAVAQDTDCSWCGEPPTLPLIPLDLNDPSTWTVWQEYFAEWKLYDACVITFCNGSGSVPIYCTPCGLRPPWPDPQDPDYEQQVLALRVWAYCYQLNCT